MFKKLVGRNFSARCKHSIKCIRSRIVVIRRKKHAMLGFLKKDVAELLANAHSFNAYGRMDDLMIEMNRISCYDIIDDFCQHVLLELPHIQKHKELPQEEMEAVATLLFAAARFSDLPELCDLRCLFSARYGTCMDSRYVNAEFAAKASTTKTFPEDVKLKLMEDIAREFSVEWDSVHGIFVQEESSNEADEKAATLRKTQQPRLGPDQLQVGDKCDQVERVGAPGMRGSSRRCDGRVHPRLPDYDQLAAHFGSLRTS